MRIKLIFLLSALISNTILAESFVKSFPVCKNVQLIESSEYYKHDENYWTNKIKTENIDYVKVPEVTFLGDGFKAAPVVGNIISAITRGNYIDRDGQELRKTLKTLGKIGIENMKIAISYYERLDSCLTDSTKKGCLKVIEKFRTRNSRNRILLRDELVMSVPRVKPQLFQNNVNGDFRNLTDQEIKKHLNLNLNRRSGLWFKGLQFERITDPKLIEKYIQNYRDELDQVHGLWREEIVNLTLTLKRLRISECKDEKEQNGCTLFFDTQKKLLLNLKNKKSINYRTYITATKATISRKHIESYKEILFKSNYWLFFKNSNPPITEIRTWISNSITKLKETIEDDKKLVEDSNNNLRSLAKFILYRPILEKILNEKSTNLKWCGYAKAFDKFDLMKSLASGSLELTAMVGGPGILTRAVKSIHKIVTGGLLIFTKAQRASITYIANFGNAAGYTIHTNMRLNHIEELSVTNYNSDGNYDITSYKQYKQKEFELRIGKTMLLANIPFTQISRGLQAGVKRYKTEATITNDISIVYRHIIEKTDDLRNLFIKTYKQSAETLKNTAKDLKKTAKKINEKGLEQFYQNAKKGITTSLKKRLSSSFNDLTPAKKYNSLTGHNLRIVGMTKHERQTLFELIDQFNKAYLKKGEKQELNKFWAEFFSEMMVNEYRYSDAEKIKKLVNLVSRADKRIILEVSEFSVTSQPTRESIITAYKALASEVRYKAELENITMTPIEFIQDSIILFSKTVINKIKSFGRKLNGSRTGYIAENLEKGFSGTVSQELIEELRTVLATFKLTPYKVLTSFNENWSGNQRSMGKVWTKVLNNLKNDQGVSSKNLSKIMQVLNKDPRIALKMEGKKIIEISGKEKANKLVQGMPARNVERYQKELVVTIKNTNNPDDYIIEYGEIARAKDMIGNFEGPLIKKRCIRDLSRWIQNGLNNPLPTRYIPEDLFEKINIIKNIKDWKSLSEVEEESLNYILKLLKTAEKYPDDIAANLPTKLMVNTLRKAKLESMIKNRQLSTNNYPTLVSNNQNVEGIVRSGNLNVQDITALKVELKEINRILKDIVETGILDKVTNSSAFNNRLFRQAEVLDILEYSYDDIIKSVDTGDIKSPLPIEFQKLITQIDSVITAPRLAARASAIKRLDNAKLTREVIEIFYFKQLKNLVNFFKNKKPSKIQGAVSQEVMGAVQGVGRIVLLARISSIPTLVLGTIAGLDDGGIFTMPLATLGAFKHRTGHIFRQFTTEEITTVRFEKVPTEKAFKKKLPVLFYQRFKIEFAKYRRALAKGEKYYPSVKVREKMEDYLLSLTLLRAKSGSTFFLNLIAKIDEDSKRNQVKNELLTILERTLIGDEEDNITEIMLTMESIIDEKDDDLRNRMTKRLGEYFPEHVDFINIMVVAIVKQLDALKPKELDKLIYQTIEVTDLVGDGSMASDMFRDYKEQKESSSIKKAFLKFVLESVKDLNEEDN